MFNFERHALLKCKLMEFVTAHSCFEPRAATIHRLRLDLVACSKKQNRDYKIGKIYTGYDVWFFQFNFNLHITLK